MAVGDANVFPGFLKPVLTQLFFPKPLTTFLTCFCRVERRKYAGKKVRLNRGSNLYPPGHESDTFNTEPLGRGFSWLALVQVLIIFKPLHIAVSFHGPYRCVAYQLVNRFRQFVFDKVTYDDNRRDKMIELRPRLVLGRQLITCIRFKGIF